MQGGNVAKYVIQLQFPECGNNGEVLKERF